MTERQLEIHKGLQAIGPEIAQFYLDGLEITTSNLGIKSNLLAHILREIDGGLRDIFEQKKLKEELQNKLKKEDLEKIFNKFKEDYKNFDYLCDISFEEFKKAKGHISSILVSFGFSIDHPLSIQYIKVVRWLAKYAHRSGSYNEPRTPGDIINLWNEFEDVLSKLIGNYYALADRIDSILKVETPTQEILKTLPHLLNTESRFVYFFNGLESAKWLLQLEKEGYFDGSKNPESVESKDNPGYYSMPYWGILNYLEKIAKKNLDIPEKEITESLVRIIDNISQFKNAEEQRIENYRTDYTIFKIICTIPKNYLDERHFSIIKDSQQSKSGGFIGHSYNEFLERLISINDKKLLLQGVQLLLAFNVNEGPFEKVNSIFRSYELQKILSDLKDKLITILGKDILNLSLQKVFEVIEKDQYSFNNISIPAIEDHEQTTFTDKYDCQLIYLIRDSLEKLSSEDIIETLNELIISEQPILRRLAIHTVRVRYDEFKELFWNLGKNPLSIPLAKHEIYELLKEHSTTFNDKEIEQVINWIKTKEYYIPEESKDDKVKVAKSIAYRKKEWLTSLVLNDSEAIMNMLEELNAVNKANVDHPGFDTWHSGMIGVISPLNLEEIVKLSIEETIEFYQDFNNKEHDFIGPSVDGFIDTLTLSIRHNPEKYNVQCQSINEAPSQILYSWIRGLGESWRDEKKEFECGEILQTVIEILQKESFWKSHNGKDNHSRWFVSSLLSFIKDGVHDDNHAFNAKHLPIIKNILFIILEQDTYPVFDYSDLSMTVLNNSRGRIYTALFQYSLRLARVEGKESNRWDIDVKELISQKIESDEDNPLLYHVIGQFLPNIHFLDENWMIENFDKLFQIDSKTNWSAAMSGYFFYHRELNEIYFKLLMENHHLLKAISEGSLIGEVRNSLIRQICSAYLHEFKSIEIDSDIIQILIESKNENTYSSIIYFFGSIRFHSESKILNKIKPLWVKIYNKSIKLENDEIDRFALSGCCKWLNIIGKIDEELFEVLSKSVPYVNQRDRHSVIEALSKHINNFPKKVGLILIELLKKEVSYDISRGKLKKMVEILYEKGYKNTSDEICLLHAEKGLHFLRDSYDKYNI